MTALKRISCLGCAEVENCTLSCGCFVSVSGRHHRHTSDAQLFCIRLSCACLFAFVRSVPGGGRRDGDQPRLALRDKPHVPVRGSLQPGPGSDHDPPGEDHQQQICAGHWAVNYLAHAWLSRYSTDSLVGGMLGDFVKGRIDGRFSDPVCTGIRLHRAIDNYTDKHPLFRASRARISARRRRFAGIMVDVFYDHFALILTAGDSAVGTNQLSLFSVGTPALNENRKGSAARAP